MIKIITKDEIFGRAVAIELKGAGLDSEITNKSITPAGTVIIVDLDCLSDDEISLLKKSANERLITFSLFKGAGEFSRPFLMEDLIKRVSKLFTPMDAAQLPLADRISFEGDSVTVSGEIIPLTKKEAALLSLLMSFRGNTVSPEQAACSVWGSLKNTNIVNVYIRYLRKKLDDRFNCRMILTVREKGYKIE